MNYKPWLLTKPVSMASPVVQPIDIAWAYSFTGECLFDLIKFSSSQIAKYLTLPPQLLLYYLKTN
ncbi:hypothetical protein DP113_21715 [Brasilonema octagenarum UFV-E1]|uniref:Uncharacterized protein n=1 Tax=Brasilonema sennae CENA114 TaxID=415709 RepID=A0A856MFS7_9CYAN|nr:hypothetical protein DP114_21790 [Brasilonema sennae CENA114]QDL16528.1 hypothetical protein DP113_21715 [Brasilonema octagenarum UFV-E1]